MDTHLGSQGPPERVWVSKGSPSRRRMGASLRKTISSGLASSARRSPIIAERFSIATVWIWTTRVPPNLSTTTPGRSSDSDHTSRWQPGSSAVDSRPGARLAIARSKAPRRKEASNSTRPRPSLRHTICDLLL